MKCQKCGAKVKRNAKYCPECGELISEAQGCTAPAKKRAKWWVWVLIVIVLLFATGVFSFEEVEEDTEEPEQVEDITDIATYMYEAQIMAEEIVESCLASPKTADFCSLDECRMRRYDMMYAVSGYVDSQNAFGAMIRNNYIVQFVIINPKSFSYETTYVNIGGETAGEYVEFPEA